MTTGYSIEIKGGSDEVFFSEKLLSKLGRGFILHIEADHKAFRIVQISDASDVRMIKIRLNADGSMKMSEWLGQIIREIAGKLPSEGVVIYGEWAEFNGVDGTEKCFRFKAE